MVLCCRPLKSSHSFINIIQKTYLYHQWFIYGNIKKCLGGVNLQYLLYKIDTFLLIKNLIHYWVSNDQQYFGLFLTLDISWIKLSPYYNIISIYPLMFNIMLHGLDLYIECFVRIQSNHLLYRQEIFIQLYRYDDLLIIFTNISNPIKHLNWEIDKWLRFRGFTLLPFSLKSNMKLVQQYKSITEQINLLGFSIHRKLRENIKSDVSNSYILPTKYSLKKHFYFIHKIIQSNATAKQVRLIKRLNPIISSFHLYYAPFIDNKIFIKYDYKLFQLVWKWAYKRHNYKNIKWITNKYFYENNQKGNVFSVINKGIPEVSLYKYYYLYQQRTYIPCFLDSPYNGQWIYFMSILKKRPLEYKQYLILCHYFYTSLFFFEQ